MDYRITFFHLRTFYVQRNENFLALFINFFSIYIFMCESVSVCVCNSIGLTVSNIYLPN